MHIEDTQDKFVELRAQGWSLGHIATELHVSKRTLVEWNREFANDIQSFRATEQELLQEKFLSSREEDLNRLARLQKDVEDELANRPLKFIPIEKLFRLSMDLRHEIHALSMEQDPQAGQPRAGGGCQNGHGQGRIRPANRRKAPQEKYRPAPVPENPPRSGEAIDSALPPYRLTAKQPRQNGTHLEEEAESRSKQEPLPPVSSVNRPAAAPVSPSSPSESDGVSPLPSNGAARQLAVTAPTTPKTTPDNPRPDDNPLEHCLACGAELPALLPTGRQVSHYCECGQSLSLPGLNLREHCPQCGFALPVHGYNTQRLSDTCPACAATLPSLDPKAFAPWVGPNARSSIRHPGNP